MEDQKRIRMAVIAGAAHATKFKEKNWLEDQKKGLKNENKSKRTNH